MEYMTDMKRSVCLNSLVRLLPVLLAFAVLTLSGCREQPRAVEVVKKEPDRTLKPTPAPTPAVETSYTEPIVARPTPRPVPTPIVLMAVDMPITSGTPDNEGGVCLPMNGKIMTESLKIDFPVHKVVMEMKGRPAGGVWPLVNLNTRNQTIQKNFAALPRTFVTTSTYHLYHLPQKPPLPPGDYQITFRFYNNQDLDGEDRAVFLRKIEFHPEEPEEE